MDLGLSHFIVGCNSGEASTSQLLLLTILRQLNNRFHTSRRPMVHTPLRILFAKFPKSSAPGDPDHVSSRPPSHTVKYLTGIPESPRSSLVKIRSSVAAGQTPTSVGLPSGAYRSVLSLGRSSVENQMSGQDSLTQTRSTAPFASNAPQSHASSTGEPRGSNTREPIPPACLQPQAHRGPPSP